MTDNYFSLGRIRYWHDVKPSREGPKFTAPEVTNLWGRSRSQPNHSAVPTRGVLYSGAENVLSGSRRNPCLLTPTSPT